jgi:hypothetical protein
MMTQLADNNDHSFDQTHYAPTEDELHYNTENEERRIFFDSFNTRFVKVTKHTTDERYSLYDANDNYITSMSIEKFKDFWVELKPVPIEAVENPVGYLMQWIDRHVLHESGTNGGIRYAIGMTDVQIEQREDLDYDKPY